MSGVRVFNARSEFGTEWYRFKNPAAGQGNILTLPLSKQHFPFRSRGPDITISIPTLALICLVDPADAPPLSMNVTVGAATTNYSLSFDSGPGVWRSQEKKITQNLGQFVLSGTAADVAKIQELILVCPFAFA